VILHVTPSCHYRGVFESSNAFCGRRLHPDPLEELQRFPDPLAAIGGRVLLLRRREGRGKGWDRGGREGK